MKLNAAKRESATEMDRRLRAFTDSFSELKHAKEAMAKAKCMVAESIRMLGFTTSALEDAERSFCLLIYIDGMERGEFLELVKSALHEWNKQGGTIKYSSKTFGKRFDEIQIMMSSTK